jgi:adenylate cyclase
VQTAIAAKAGDVAEERRIAFRIGLHVGDIILDDNDIFGDGVNIAARLQETATLGGLCISGRAHDDIRDRLRIAFKDGGAQPLNNIARQAQVWR